MSHANLTPEGERYRRRFADASIEAVRRQEARHVAELERIDCNMRRNILHIVLDALAGAVIGWFVTWTVMR